MKKDRPKSFTYKELMQALERGEHIDSFKIKVTQKYKPQIETPIQLLQGCFSSKN